MMIAAQQTATAQTTIDIATVVDGNSGTGWRFNEPILRISENANVLITGTVSNGRRIEVGANAKNVKITLNGVRITLDTNQSPLLLNTNAEVDLTIEGTNYLIASGSRAGIQTTGATLTISGAGSLLAVGGTGGAGIGGSSGGAGGTITINGGEITAIGPYNAAGIGSGANANNASNTNITIAGGIVRAGDTTTHTGIGGDLYSGTINITITGGTVTATGTSIGIGGGDASITINGGVVTATGVGTGFGIGGIQNIGALTMTGNALVFASSVKDLANAYSRPRTGGILVAGVVTHWYGPELFTLTQDVTIPENYIMTVQDGKTLTIPSGIILCNRGVVVNNGTINNSVASWPCIPYINYNVDDLKAEIDLGESNPNSIGIGWKYNNDVYFIESGANVHVFGSNAGSQRRLEVLEGATNVTIILDGVSITGLAANQSPLRQNWSSAATSVALDIVGTNILTAGNNCAGIEAPSATLTINGTGSLVATGGNNGAGIGGGNNGDSGNITISGGVVTASGGANAAGIGGGNNRNGGNVTISGGTVIATGGTGTNGLIGGAGIGGGASGSAGQNTTINGGVVTATGGANAAGIGNGSNNTTGRNLTMNGDAVVFASSLVNNNNISLTTTQVVRGILFDDSEGTFYGTNVTISGDVTTPPNSALTICAGQTLTILT